MHYIKFLMTIAAYVVPLYITNGCALLFGGGRPLDLGKKIFGKPIFGRGKTVRGTCAGLISGLLSVFIIAPLVPKWFVSNYVAFGNLLVLGALTGDILASFLKRRLGFKSGCAVPVLDQLDFVFGGIVFTAWMRVPSIAEFTALLIITLFMHRFSNYIAYKVKIKEVPW